MECANCGNTNPKTLWNEGDTIYCSECCHRTRVSDGKDDLVRCPYCGELRDRKAMVCMWCGSSWNDYGQLSTSDFSEIKKFKESLTPDDVRYWNTANADRNNAEKTVETIINAVKIIVPFGIYFYTKFKNRKR